MTCFYPRDGWKSKRLNENGKREIVFRRSDGYEDMHLQVPCGKCSGCRADEALSWAIRSYQEASLFEQNTFVTLTYDDDHLPVKLKKDHLQKFFRALRKENYKIRYYACGEYGSQTMRPHYHALIFGSDFKNGSEIKINNELYSVPQISKIWGKGNVLFSEFTMATACYTAGYVGKKINNTESDEFRLQSSRPGIGFSWLERYWPDLINTETVVIEGQQFPIPQAYFRHMEDQLAKMHGPEIKNPFIKVKNHRAERFRKMDHETRFDKHRERRAKETYQKQKVQHQKEKGKL